MDIRVLGPVEVVGPAGFVAIGGRKQRTALAMLVAAGGDPVSVDRLFDGLWGDDPPPGARSVVQTFVSNLRKALDGVIHRRGDGYALPVARRDVDAHRFEDGVAAGRLLRSARPSAAAARLTAALAEWRGPAYEDVLQRGLIHAEVVRLEATRLVALEDRIDADLACGRHAEVEPELDALTEQHPLRERLCAQHMLALYRCERQADALRAYQRARRGLRSLGIEPSPSLQELELLILCHDDSLSLAP